MRVSKSWLQRYQTLLGVGLIAMFFTNVALYLFEEGYWNQPPLVWIELFAIAALPLIFTRVSRLSPELLTWILIFVALTAIYFVFSPPTQAVLQELRTRALSGLYLFVAALVFAVARTSSAEHTLRRCFAAATVAATIANVYEFFHPFAFSLLNVGRPAGLYVNPNQSAIVIVLGTVIAWPSLSAAARLPFLMSSIVGVVVTFSRGGTLALALSMIVLLVSSKDRNLLTRKQLAALVAGLALAFVIVKSGRTSHWFGPDLLTSAMSARVYWFGSAGGGLDDSAAERVDVLRLAWRMFADHPIAGNGLASTVSWELRESTHNMYLCLMDDYGIIGALILPALVVVSTRKGWQARGRESYRAFAIAILTWGFFSHNILTEFHTLTAIAFVAAFSFNGKEQQNTSEIRVAATRPQAHAEVRVWQ